jgi:hypothetical protein
MDRPGKRRIKMKLETFEKWLKKNGYTKHPQIGGGYFKNTGLSDPIGFIVSKNGDVDYCQLTGCAPVIIKGSCLAKLSVTTSGKLACTTKWIKTGKKVLI